MVIWLKIKNIGANMKKNIGSIDKSLRILLGLAIIIIGIFYESWLGLVGIIPILTAFIGFCPLYSLIGLSTCQIKDK
jgi:hypothetical protein